MTNARNRHLIGHLKLLIHDLENALEDGTVLTEGYLTHRLVSIMSGTKFNRRGSTVMDGVALDPNRPEPPFPGSKP